MSLYFARHAESEVAVIDAPLTATGRQQAASNLEGHFDWILCSPLRCCIETLHCSRITYDTLIVNPNLRDRVWTASTRMLLEKPHMVETMTNVYQRADMFQLELIELMKKIEDQKKILIISHGIFLLAWLGEAVAMPEYAKILPLTLH